MSGGSLASTQVRIGSNANCAFLQSGGTCSISGLVVGDVLSGSLGTYSLTGTASLNVADGVDVGQSYGAGRLELLTNALTTPQLALGANGTLAVGFDFSMASLSSGAVFHGTTLTGLNLATLEVTNGATATQADGVARTVGGLTIGSTAGAGTFQLASGSLTTAYLSSSNGSLQLGNATLQINGGLQGQGTIEGLGGGGGSIIASNSIVDLSQMTLVNVASTSLTADANSLVIVSPTVNPASVFGSYSNLGMTHTAGTTLVVPAGQGFCGLGTIVDPVDCQGSIAVSNSTSSLNLTGGLSLSGSGTINLGNGSLTTNDNASVLSGGQLFVANHYVGNAGTGSFTHTGGTNTVSNNLMIGTGTSGNGTYTLTGSGVLNTPEIDLGNGGVGNFLQSGGTNNVTWELWVGYQTGSPGTYTLTGNGQLNASSVEVAAGGNGSFVQTGGTCSVSALGFCDNTAYACSGSYTLSGNSLFNADYVALPESFALPASSAFFRQSGGTNSTSYLAIGPGGRYQFAAGTLLINGGLQNWGTFDGAGGQGVLVVGSSSIVDLSQGSTINTGSMSLSIGADSLLIIPPGFNPATAFASYSNAGMVHTAGTPLVLAAGQSFAGAGTILDPVVCQGSISTSPSSDLPLVLQGGLIMSGSAQVNLLSLESGVITNDATSGMSGGTLQGQFQFIGYNGTGTFTQTGGINASGTLYLGYNTGDLGTYVLSSGQMSPSIIEIGQGTGRFIQIGGTVAFSGNSATISGGSGPVSCYNLGGNGLLTAEYLYLDGYFIQSGGKASTETLYLGYGSGGTYNLNGNGLLAATEEIIGQFGTGTFLQSQGTNKVSQLSLGVYNGGSGSYSLSGSGVLVAGTVSVGDPFYSALGSFLQAGGTATIGYLNLNRGSYILNGGLLDLGILSSGTGSILTFGGGTLQCGNNTSSILEPIMLGTVGQQLPMKQTANSVRASSCEFACVRRKDGRDAGDRGHRC